MKKFYVLLMAASGFLGASAQTYPYSEGFEGINSGSGVNGVNGMTATFNVYAYSGFKKGFNGSKAAQIQMSTSRRVDSFSTPLIGPLTSSSQLTFLFPR